MRKKQKTFNGGQSLVEFALILPILLLFLMVILDLGRAVYFYSAIHNAAREGARNGAVRWYDPEPLRTNNIINAAKSLTAGFSPKFNDPLPTYIDLDSAVDSDGDGNTANDLDVVQVTVTYDFRAATPILAQLMGSGVDMITLRSRATMRTER